MSQFRLLPVVAAGALLGMVGFAGRVAFAGDTDRPEVDVNKVSNFVKNADLSLTDAIKKAEQECNGKAIHAIAVCDHEHGTAGKEHFKVCCLAQGNKIVSVCVDSRNGNVLAKHESTTLPVAFRSDGSSDSTSRTAMNLRLQKATDLIGKSVENNKGEKLGEVQDLAVDPDRGGRVVYAVLSFGGFLGMGEKWFAVPMGALTLPDHAKHFVLGVEKDRLKNAVGFDKDRWPKMGDTTWGTSIHEFYGQQPYWMEGNDRATPSSEMRIQKTSEIIGRDVQNDRGEKLGDIKDLMIDVDRSKIVYGVLSFGGFLGMGDKLFAIPTGALQMPGTASYVVITADKDRLKDATGFEPRNWPNMADPTFVTKTHEFYGQRPYSTEEKSRK